MNYIANAGFSRNNYHFPLVRPANQGSLGSFKQFDYWWRQLTDYGHQAYCRGDHGKAHNFYQHAWDEAERLLDIAKEGGCHDGVLLLVLSSQNLSKNWDKLKHPYLAGEILRTAFLYIKETAMQNALPLSLRKKCLNHLGDVTDALLHHIKYYGGSDQDIVDILDQAGEVFVYMMKQAEQEDLP